MPPYNSDDIRHYIIVTRDGGAIGDDATDNTSAINHAISLLQDGDMLYVPRGTFLVGTPGLTFSNLNNISVVIDGVLKFKDNDAANISLLNFINCTRLRALIRANGNVQNNGVTLSEHKHLVLINGGSQIDLQLAGVNLPGDGVYLTGGAQHVSLSVNCKNATYAGRNAVSIINGSDIVIPYLISDHIGYATMPGGLDIEPDSAADVVQRVTVGNALINAGGTAGLQVYNGVGATVSDIIIKSAHVTKAATSPSGNAPFVVNTATRVVADVVCDAGGSTNSFAAQIAGSSYVDLKCQLSNSTYGVAMLGTSSHISIAGLVKDVTAHGIIFISGTCDHINVSNFKAVNCDSDASGNGFAIRVEDAATVNNVVIQNSDLSKMGNTVRPLHRGTGTISNWVIRNCDVSGYGLVQPMTGFESIDKINCIGLNFATGAPASGTWKTNDLVWNTTPASLGYVGWVCVTGGTPGTWKGFGVIA